MVEEHKNQDSYLNLSNQFLFFNNIAADWQWLDSFEQKYDCLWHSNYIGFDHSKEPPLLKFGKSEKKQPTYIVLMILEPSMLNGKKMKAKIR